MARSDDGLWDIGGPPSTVEARLPGNYLADQLMPLFQEQLPPVIRGSDREIESEEHFWLDAPRHFFSTIYLREIYLCDWFPRTPGMYWTSSARDARDSIYSSSEHHDPQLGTFLFPKAKRALVEDGGIGSVRLSPKSVDGVRCWFATALRDNFCDAGIPLAIPEDLLFQKSVNWGDAVDIVGRVRFLNDAGLTQISTSVHGIRPLIVFVEEIKSLGSFLAHEVVIRPIVLFERDHGLQHSNDSMGYVFATCVANQGDEYVDQAADWMERYAARFHGRVITNFDEQLPRIADAPLSYQRLVRKTFERQIINHYLGDSFVTRIENLNFGGLHMGHNINVGGNALINIGSTLNNVSQTIGSSTGLSDKEKSDLNQLIQKLRTDLETIKDSHPDEAQAIVKALDQTVSYAGKPPGERKTSLIHLSADGLVAAAKMVAEVAPPILGTATLIAKFVLGLG